MSSKRLHEEADKRRIKYEKIIEKRDDEEVQKEKAILSNKFKRLNHKNNVFYNYDNSLIQRIFKINVKTHFLKNF